MKYKNPKREIREKEWFRIPAPENFFRRMELKYKLRDYDSDGHYWVDQFHYTHFWVDNADDALWFLLTTK